MLVLNNNEPDNTPIQDQVSSKIKQKEWGGRKVQNLLDMEIGKKMVEFLIFKVLSSVLPSKLKKA